ncbi:MAG: oligosaccharide flippase family protein [Tissierellaceae bacterium]|nr:oligosaccharide flippase family protein [Tissierellaceae bacterium]
MNKDSLVYRSIIMVIMNFFIRFIGFVYGIFLSRLLGAETLGLLQIANSTMMVFLILTTSGIPTSITKLVAEENSKNKYSNIEKIYKSTMTFNLITSIILGLLLFVFAELISIKIFKNIDMLIIVYLLIPAIIIISLSNILRSFFYGMKNMIIPSIAQIIEHVTRFIFVIGLLYLLKPNDPIHSAIIAIIGIGFGEFFDLLWSLANKKRLYKINSKAIPSRQKFQYLTKILTISLPLTISGFFHIILMFSNSVLIPNRLITAGYSSNEALAIFGRITGMTMPLITLPFIVTSALAVNLITSLSEKMITKKFNDLRHDIELSIRITLLVSIPLMVIYIVLSKPIAYFLYNDIFVAKFIQVMGFSTVFFALQHTFSGILYGIGKQTSATINRILGMVVRVILIYSLMGDPKIGVNGFFISFFVSIFITLLLDIVTLESVIKIKLNYCDSIIKPLFASLFMVGFIYIFTYEIDSLQFSNPIAFFSTLGIGALSYFFILILTKAIPKIFKI